MDKEKEYQDAAARRVPFTEEHYGHPVAEKRLEGIVVRSKGKVLELGGGEGHVTRALLDAGLSVEGIEISTVRRDRARRDRGVELLPGNVNYRLPYEDDSFDTVVAGELLEHLPNPGNCLGEMARITRSRLILTLPIHPDFDTIPSHFWAVRIIDIEGRHAIVMMDKINRGNVPR